MDGNNLSTTSCKFCHLTILHYPLHFLRSRYHDANYQFRVCDKSVRYVAEENILRTGDGPSEAMLRLAGRHFKRWDAGINRFVSNVRDEYPDD
jgi:F-box protein 21